MLFAEYPIERAYLLHELAQCHLDNNSFDAACSLARKALEGLIQMRFSFHTFHRKVVFCRGYQMPKCCMDLPQSYGYLQGSRHSGQD